MVHAIDMETVAKAASNFEALTELLVQVHRHGHSDADLALDLIQSNDKAIALALESLLYHLKGDHQHQRVRAHLEHALSLDALFFFFTVPDADLVIEAACDLLQAWIDPYPPARLLENEDLLVQGLAHPNGNVRILVLRQLAKLNAPGDWTPSLALASVQAIHTPSIPVFDAFIQLLTHQDTATTLFTDPHVIDYMQTQLLTHRTHSFRALEILGRLVRFSPTTFPNTRALLANLFSTRFLHNPLDYAAFCHHAAMFLMPTSATVPGNPSNAAALLTDTGIFGTVLDRTLAMEEPESGLPLLIALVALDPTHALCPPILDTAAQFIQACTRDDATDPAPLPRDRTNLLALITLRSLADTVPDCTTLLHHPRVLQSLVALFSQVQTASAASRDALLLRGVLQFLAAMAPKPLGDALVTSIVCPPAFPPGTHVGEVLQPWVSVALAATSHMQPEVQFAGYATLTAMADVEWAWWALVRDDRLAFLLMRSSGDNAAVKRIKYDAVHRLGQWVDAVAGKVDKEGVPLVDPLVKPRIDEFVKHGPYYTPRVANVVVDDAV